jgi:phosphatidylglycerophosphate synthase
MPAHLLTALRLLATLPLILAMRDPGAPGARVCAACLLTAILTDCLDGPLARRTGTASPAGRLFDHTTDVVFVTAGLFAGASRGAFPWLLPCLVAFAFAQYVLDSYWLEQRSELRMSTLGRWNGILFFVPIGGDVLARLIWSGLHGPVRALCWILVVTTLLSIGDRALSAWERRRTQTGSELSRRGETSEP